MSVLILPVWYMLGMSIDSGASVRELTKLFVCWCAFTEIKIHLSNCCPRVTSIKKNTTQKLHRLHTLHVTSRRRRPNLIKIVSIVCAKFVQFHSSYKKCRN